MNAATPVQAEALCLSEFVRSGIMAREAQGGAERFWTGREEKILRVTYRVGGLAACVAAPPIRSLIVLLASKHEAAR